MKNELIHKIVTDIDKPSLRCVHTLERHTLAGGKKYFVLRSSFRNYKGDKRTMRETYQTYEVAARNFYNKVNPVL